MKAARVGPALILLWVCLSPGLDAQTVILKQEVVFGTAFASVGSPVPMGAFGITGQSATQPWAGSLGYRWIGILRTCEGPLEKPCSLEVSGGHAFLLGIARIQNKAGGIRQTLGVEIGVSHFSQFTGHSWRTHPMLCLRGGLQVPMGFGSLDLGGLLQLVPSAVMPGLTAGFSVQR